MYTIINDEIINNKRTITTKEDNDIIRSFTFPLEFSNEKILKRIKELLIIYKKEEEQIPLSISQPLIGINIEL